MDHYSFAMQHRTFDVHGYALSPSSTSKPIIGSLNSAHQNGYATIESMRTPNAVKRETKRKRGAKGDSGVVEGDESYLGPWAEWEGDKDVVPEVEEEAEEWREEKRKREEAKVAAQERMKLAREEKSIFHGERLTAGSSLIFRQGTHRLCRTDIYAHTYRCRRQAESFGRRSATQRLRPGEVYPHMGESEYTGHG